MKKKLQYFYRSFIGLPLIRKMGILLLSLSFLVFEVGLVRNWPQPFNLRLLLEKVVDDYYANISTDFLVLR